MVDRMWTAYKYYDWDKVGGPYCSCSDVGLHNEPDLKYLRLDGIARLLIWKRYGLRTPCIFYFKT